MNWMPIVGIVPGPVEFGVVGGVAWLVVAAVALVPAMLVANGLYEIGIREGLNALIDLAAPKSAERRVA
jgi:hypothetical protein